MNITSEHPKEHNLGKLALAVCLGGTLLAVAIGLAEPLIGKDAPIWAFLLFVAFQVAALVLGIITRAQPLGRASAIVSAIFLLIALAIVAMWPVMRTGRSSGAPEPPTDTVPRETEAPKK